MRLVLARGRAAYGQWVTRHLSIPFSADLAAIQIRQSKQRKTREGALMTTTQEQTVLELAHSRYFERQAWHLAHKWHLDIDDVRQDIAEIILTTLPRIPERGRDKKTYLAVTINNHFRARHDEKYSHQPAHILSLDEPLSDDPECSTLADILEVPPVMPANERRQIQREQALYDALHRLHIDEQLYLQRVYKLFAFCPSNEPPTGRTDHSVAVSSYRKLRRNTTLATAVAR